MIRTPLIYTADGTNVVRLLQGSPIIMSMSAAKDLLAAHRRLNRSGASPAANLIPQLDAAIRDAEQHQPQPKEPEMTPTIRQGDVFLKRVDELPKGLKEAKRDRHGHIVLALGEHSGHRHAIRDKHVTSFRMETANRDASLSADVDYIEVGGSGATLNHEYVTGVKADHEPVSLAPGVYKVVGQRTYSPKEIVRAVD